MTRLSDRVTRLLSGSIHALVESIEDAAAETVMSEAIREITRAINDVRKDLGSVVAEKHRVTQTLSENSSAHEHLTQQIDIAVSENRDDLAAAAIEEQIKLEEKVPPLERRIAELSEQEKDLETCIQSLRTKQTEMQDEFLAIKKREAENKTDVTINENGATNPHNPALAKAEAAISDFERASGSFSSSDPSDHEQAAKLQELKTLVKNTEIANRLAEARARAASSSEPS